MKPKMLVAKTPIFQHDHHAVRWFLDLGKIEQDIAFADLFEPSFWRGHVSKIHQFDLLRVIARDGSFDVMLRVAAKAPEGLILELWPQPYPGTPEFAALQAAAAQTRQQADVAARAAMLAPPVPADRMPPPVVVPTAALLPKRKGAAA